MRADELHMGVSHQYEGKAPDVGKNRKKRVGSGMQQSGQGEYCGWRGKECKKDPGKPKKVSRGGGGTQMRPLKDGGDEVGTGKRKKKKKKTDGGCSKRTFWTGKNAKRATCKREGAANLKT